jgi:hypothetical protein
LSFFASLKFYQVTATEVYKAIAFAGGMGAENFTEKNGVVGGWHFVDQFTFKTSQ